MTEVQQSDGFRWWVLCGTAMGMFAYGYAYDNPVALQRQLLKTYNLSNVQYNLLYSIYAFPNMILPAISGVISDKIGYDWLVIFFFGLMVLAQGIFVFGCYLNGLFSILIIGRLTFGIGAESHALVETPLIYDYFKGKELAFALALHLSMARAGSSVNDICTYLAYSSYNGSINDKIVFATSIGLFILFILWMCIIIMILVHRVKVKRKKLLAKILRKHKRKKQNKDGGRDSSLSSATMKGVAVSVQNDDIIERLVSVQNNDITTDRGDITPKQDIYNHKEENKVSSVISYGTVTSKMKLSDIKEFDIVFWLLVWNCAIMYGIVLSWMNIGSDFLQITYGYSHGKANALLTIPYSIAGILQPIWGWISDKVGWRSQFLLISSFIFVLAHYMLGWIRVDNNPVYVPIIALTLLGFGYSVFTAVIWPCFPLVVPPRAIGTAYGIPTSGYNLILTIYYVLIGVFTSSVDNQNKYLGVQWFLLITSLITVITSLFLIYKDMNTGWRLYDKS
eukprot:381711_1